MLRDFHALSFSGLAQPVGYAQPMQAAPAHVTLDSAATDVMTDLTRVAGVIILPGDAIGEAHRRMIQRGGQHVFGDRGATGALTARQV